MGAQLLISLYHPDLVLNAGVAGASRMSPSVPSFWRRASCSTMWTPPPSGDPVGLVSTVNQIQFPTGGPACRQGRHGCHRRSLPYRLGGHRRLVRHRYPRSHWIADTFHPLLCEMEGCAVAQVCLRNGVKFMAIKSVSDCLFEHHDFAFNFPAAMKDLNRVVMAFLTQLTKE